MKEYLFQLNCNILGELCKKKRLFNFSLSRIINYSFNTISIYNFQNNLYIQNIILI